jgi:hypothetical protein
LKAILDAVLTAYLVDVGWRSPFSLADKQREVILEELLILKSVLQHASLLIV